MAQSKTLSGRIDEIAERLEEIEARMSDSVHPDKAEGGADAALRYCAVPETPEREFAASVSNERAALIRTMAKKWVNGTVLHFYFFSDDRFGGEEAQEQVVRQGFQVWRDVGIGLNFEEVASAEDAEIRIGFVQGDGAWSYVGRDVLNQGQGERTMNFGWDLTRAGEVDTAVHEIGHTLGFPHEHQNPNAGIVWNEDAVIQSLGGSPNFWSEQQTRWNILRKIPQDSVEGSRWDPNSIMHYPFEAGLIDQPAEYRNGLDPDPGLSEKDIVVFLVTHQPSAKGRSMVAKA